MAQIPPDIAVRIVKTTCHYAQPVIHYRMMISIVVVTSDTPFGELIRQSLEGTGRFTVRVTGDNQTAVDYVKQTKCPLAFLDGGLIEKKVLTAGTLLRDANPDLSLVVVSDSGQRPWLDQLSPDGYLSKPFYLPDLMELVEELPEPPAPTEEAIPVSLPKPAEPVYIAPAGEDEVGGTWLSDVTKAAQHLTRLTLESSAQAALITKSDQLWAYAGQLPQSATKELAETVSRYWDRKEENDLVRFVRLASTEADHMLYATRLDTDMVLALIFDAETPFSTIRTQANQLVHSLSDQPSNQPSMQLSADIPSDDQTDDDGPSIQIGTILSDIPSPNPVRSVTDSAPKSSPKSIKESSPAVPLQPVRTPLFSRESSPAMPLNRLTEIEQVERPPVDLEQSRPEVEEPLPDLEKTLESAAVTRKSKPKKHEAYEDDPSITRPTSIGEIGRKIVLEPVSPSVYNLDYACLLVPRFAHHHLTGDLSDKLSEWVHETCIAFGWRLEYISVRPEYILWIANVPPVTSPGYLMRIMRQHTSEKIFAEFTRFKKENPSGDFWAPGYLMMGGSQPPPAHLIKDFISQTRQRQGISRPLR